MKIAFMFSGQGAQFPGMMKDLCQAEPASMAVFQAADRALGRGISQLSFEGAQEELNRRLNDKVNSAAFELKRETSLEVLSVKARTTLGMRPDLYAGTIIVPDRQP